MRINPLRPGEVAPSGADVDDTLAVTIHTKLEAVFRTIGNCGIDDLLRLSLKIHDVPFHYRPF